MVFGLPIVAAAVALVGAPSTPIRCNPDLPQGRLGFTSWVDVSQPASSIELGTTACAGLLLLSASPRELRKIVALNPALNVALDEGVGIQTLLMETEHTSHPYGGIDETDDLCHANAVLPALLGRYLSGEALASALRWATYYSDGAAPGTYHTHPCG